VKTCFFSMLILCTFILVQGCASTDKPKMAIYVTGDMEPKERSTMKSIMSNNFVNSGKYEIVERGEEYLKEIQKEHLKQRSGSVDEKQISAIDKQSGADYVCVTNVTESYDSKHISVQLIDAESTKVIASDVAQNKLEKYEDVEAVSKKIVDHILKTPIASKKAKNIENTENKAKDSEEIKPESKTENN